MKILVIGAGFAGAVHARILAEAGHEIDVIDRRDHIAGNCFDYVHPAGVRVHRYGPHLFHTSNQKVVTWLSQFTSWVPYEHKVKARLPDGRLVPMPVNLDTVNLLFHENFETADDIALFLQGKAIACEAAANAQDYLYGKIGQDLTDLFYRPYTLKMWGMDLKDMDADIVKRLQIRTDREDRYFPNDNFQALPAHGYTALFEKLLDHENINIQLQTEFSHDTAREYPACFNSMPIDAYFGSDLGSLPYRSIKFHLDEIAASLAPAHAVINYTDAGPYTRETWWHNMAGHHVQQGAGVVRTIEEPCDYRDNGFERFYPVKTADGEFDALYKQYAARDAGHADMNFIGRCGTYQYLDMHQVINQSLVSAEKWLRTNRA